MLIMPEALFFARCPRHQFCSVQSLDRLGRWEGGGHDAPSMVVPKAAFFVRLHQEQTEPLSLCRRARFRLLSKFQEEDDSIPVCYELRNMLKLSGWTQDLRDWKRFVESLVGCVSRNISERLACSCA